MPQTSIKSLTAIASSFLILVASSSAQDSPAAETKAANSISWSMVYLPDLEWTESEIKQTVDLLSELKPNMVVSFAPCSFADQIRNLESKPKILDQTLRETLGAKCGIAPIPHAEYKDTSTLHQADLPDDKTPSIVWLSSADNKSSFNGPRDDVYQNHEQRSLALLQVREQFAKRQGEVVFLIEPDLSIPDESEWFLPRRNVRYEQASSAITGFACIRPDTLQKEIPAIVGIASRIPVLHWIHSGPNGMEWDVLPIDKAPAIQHATYAHTAEKDSDIAPKIKWLNPPTATSEVPIWMDNYVNNNPALETGNTVQKGAMTRLFRWSNYSTDRDPFHLLRADANPALDPKLILPELPRGAVRSPNNLFSIKVGELGENGWYPVDGDDGTNVYLDDRRVNKSHLLYFQGIYGAWPSGATWFTDRYVITSGTAPPIDGWDDKSAYTGSTDSPTTLYLFDLQTGKAFGTNSYAQTNARSNAPTERIYFPDRASYEAQERWKFLWGKIEAGYQIKPEQAPIAIDKATTTAKLSSDAKLKWKDLGIWPTPETWQFASGNQDELYYGYPKAKTQATSDPFLTYTESVPGQRQYKLAISSSNAQYFDEEYAIKDIVAHADLLTTGDGRMPQLHTIERMGENKEFLLLAGTFDKPSSEKGNWMLLLDLSKHRAWSAHW